MKVEIDNLSETELVDLNHRIVQRLRLLQQMRSHVNMLEFSIGERVEFQPDGHPPVVGVVTRYNKKKRKRVTRVPGWSQCGLKRPGGMDSQFD